MEVNDRQIVFDKLDELSIHYELIEHPPIPTIEEALKYWNGIDAFHCKNLFFRNHKGNRHYMVVFSCRQQLSIKELEQKLMQGKLSFASEKRMIKYLKTIGGSVSPFGLLNDIDNHTHLFIDENMVHEKNVSFHPNDNTMTLIVSVDDFSKYLKSVGNNYEFIKLY